MTEKQPDRDRQLPVKTKEGKDSSRTKLEGKLQKNNSRERGRGMKSITGYKTSSQVSGG